MFISTKKLKLFKLCYTHRKHVKTKLDEDPDFNELPGKGPWQCVVGKSFAASLTHEAGKISLKYLISLR